MGSVGGSTTVIGAPTTALAGTRRRGPSTPVALWLFTGLLAAGLTVMGVAGTAAVTSRQQAAEAVMTDAKELLKSSETLYVALADADAASTTAYFRAGRVPSDLLQRYDDDVARAGSALATVLASESIAPAARRAAAQISDNLPAYVDAIATARTNSRLGNAVAAAYERRASTVMQSELLPAATDVYAAAATMLDAQYRSGTDRDRFGVFVTVGVVVVVALVLAQVYVAVRTRRRLNAGLLAAIVVVAVVVGYVASSLESSRRALAQSHTHGAVPTVVLATARILALRLASDENLDLIERGTVARHMEDFDATSLSIAGDDGGQSLFATAVDYAGPGPVTTSIARVEMTFENYMRGHDEIRRLADRYDYSAAIDLATTTQARRSADLDAALVDSLQTAADEGDRLARNAERRLEMLSIAIVFGVAVAAVGVAAGLGPRIREYR